MTEPAVAAVVEESDVVARGLAAYVSLAVPGYEARILADSSSASLGGARLVVCGPSSLRRLCAVRLDEPTDVPTIGVVWDAASVDFASLLAAGVEVLWDLHGTPGSFAGAVAAAERGHAWVSESLTAVMASDIAGQLRRDVRLADYGLTPRESEILQLVATGRTNRDIADRLFISQNTVKNHVRAVLDKLNAASRTEAAMIGARVGLIDVRPARK